MLERVLIVGGGPAGLSASIALRQAGVEKVHVIDAAPNDGVIGSELSMGGPMLRALDSLGVVDHCAEVGVALDKAVFRSVHGEELAATPFPPAFRQGLPPCVGITRPNLHHILRQHAAELGVHLTPGVKPTSIEQDGRNATVMRSDGDRLTCDLVIGADGVGSDVRRMLFPDAPEPRYVGQMAWRARVPRHTGPLLDVYYGPAGKAGLITVSDEDSYLFLLETAPEPKRLERSRFPEALQGALRPFGGDVGRVREEIVDPDHIHYSPLTPALLKPPWHNGQVLLIGDAAHATTPHLAYGAGLAVEDGVVLGELVASIDEPERLAAAFTERRFERCRMIVENGVQLSRWEQTPEDPQADFVGLTQRSLGALGAPI